MLVRLCTCAKGCSCRDWCRYRYTCRLNFSPVTDGYRPK
nr:MAG TPA: hypothetical protein [Caudoviricetes sp.]